MARRLLVAGNWKMNMGPGDADLLAQELKRELTDGTSVDVAVAPPFVSLQEVVNRLRHTGIGVAAQNLHWEPKGAFTGEVSAEMIRATGANRVLIGHSERRQLFGETDSTVNKKMHAAFRAGLFPMLCVGETIEERQGGKANEIVGSQLEGGMAGVTEDLIHLVTIAYEPVWAIGTGLTATPEQAQEMHAFIRAWLAERYPEGMAQALRILYGGSVTPSNATTLMSAPDIDGALVGGASLKIHSFVDIVKAANTAMRG